MGKLKIKHLLILEFGNEVENLDPKLVLLMLEKILDLTLNLIKIHGNKIIIGVPIIEYSIPHTVAHVLFEIFEPIQPLKNIIFGVTHITRGFKRDNMYKYSYSHGGVIHSTFTVNCYLDKCYIEDDMQLTSMDVITSMGVSIVHTGIDTEWDFVNLYMKVRSIQLYRLLVELHSTDCKYCVFYVIDGNLVQLY